MKQRQVKHMGMIYHIHKSTLLHPTMLGELRMYQLGRGYCESGSVVEEHFHGDFFELTVVTDGKGEVYADGAAVKVKRGDIYLSMPFETHKIVSDGAHPLKYDFFAFNMENIGLKAEFELLRGRPKDFGGRVFSSSGVTSAISEAVAEMNGGELYSGELLVHLLNRIPIYLIRAFSSPPERHTADPQTHAQVLCCRMMNYIDTNITSVKSLEELSEVFGYSYKYLSTLFKKTTSGTLSDYFKAKKLDLAAKSVTDGKLKYGEIAERLGYSSVYSFSKAFKERFGVSPRTYAASPEKRNPLKPYF